MNIIPLLILLMCTWPRNIMYPQQPPMQEIMVAERTKEAQRSSSNIVEAISG